MLHCTMNDLALTDNLRLGLDDLVADLTHARRRGDLSRMALLCYCDVRHWARRAGQTQLAETSSQLFTQPPRDRQGFLNKVDGVLGDLEEIVCACQSNSIDPDIRGVNEGERPRALDDR